MPVCDFYHIELSLVITVLAVMALIQMVKFSIKGALEIHQFPHVERLPFLAYSLLYPQPSGRSFCNTRSSHGCYKVVSMFFIAKAVLGQVV